jgi:hypothetical protein
MMFVISHVARGREAAAREDEDGARTSDIGRPTDVLVHPRLPEDGRANAYVALNAVNTAHFAAHVNWYC